MTSTIVERIIWLILVVCLLLFFFLPAFARASTDRALIMVPATLSGNGEPLSLEGLCEPSRLYPGDLECRATRVTEPYQDTSGAGK